MEIRLSPVRITAIFAAVTMLLTAVSWLTNFARYRLGYENLYGLRPIFDVGSDISIPTWYSSFALLVCAVLLGVIAASARRAGRGRVPHWTGLAIIFLLMSVDETGAVHERAGTLVSRHFETTGIFYYGWLVLGVAFVLIFAVAYLRFWLALPRGTRALFAIAGITFVAGAIGVEAYNSRYDELYGADNMHYMTMTTIEEFLEKTGIVIFIYALLRYLERHAPTFRFTLGASPPAGQP